MRKSFIKDFFSGGKTRIILGLLTFAFTLFLFFSLFSHLFYTGIDDQSDIEQHTLQETANKSGLLGAKIAYFLMNDCFGIFSMLLPLFLFLLTLKLIEAYKIRLWKWFLNLALIMIWGSVFISMIENYLPNDLLTLCSFHLGGKHGVFISRFLLQNIGSIGASSLLIALALCYLVYLSSETIRIIQKILNPWGNKKPVKMQESLSPTMPISAEEDASAMTEKRLDLLEETREGEELGTEKDTDIDFELDAPQASSVTSNEGVDFIVADTSESSATAEDMPPLLSATASHDAPVNNSSEPFDPRKSLEHYKFPALDLLKKHADDSPAIDMAEQTANKDRIIEILSNFGVGISSIKATVGPTITLYEITPAQGVRISKIRGLEDDIALSLSALGIRIIAPIPGKGTVGIEVPNKNARIVSMESILSSKRFQETTYDLPIAIGKTITNDVFMVDLAKMPHLLVAGATGQGKSVGLNAIITSLLYKKHPTELKFVMVDPKKVEFSIYTPLEKYFITKLPEEKDSIITDVTRVVKTLKSLCVLMDHRYDLLKKARVRNIKEYNEKFKAKQLNPNEGHDFMPFIVIIIDEFGDLIMTAGKEVELPIARIAQLARAVGMHMVIATQRPTTNIITGTIKANFPARMAFKVSAQIDSRTILDGAGANQLIGRGDLLFLSGMTGAEPVRVQCAFVDTPEVERINRFIEEQPGWLPPYDLPEVLEENESGLSGDLDTNNLDSMFEDVARLIVINQLGSTSLIQRKFAIGYARAGRLMDQLERAGIVGPTQGSKPREVLVADETALETILTQLRR